MEKAGEKAAAGDAKAKKERVIPAESFMLMESIGASSGDINKREK